MNSLLFKIQYEWITFLFKNHNEKNALNIYEFFEEIVQIYHDGIIVQFYFK